ncbi:MAG: hypothetical protein QXG03_10855, partial [Halalkalicoccus sp.]
MSAAELEADLSEDERAGLELVRRSGGIHQSDFWKELDVSSRKGSRIAEKLASAERGAVRDGVGAIELNLSCPNVAGAADSAAAIVAACHVIVVVPCAKWACRWRTSGAGMTRSASAIA